MTGMWKSPQHYRDLLVLLRLQLAEEEDESDAQYIEALDYFIQLFEPAKERRR